MGVAMCTKGRGTNSVKPPVSRWSARVRTRWRAQERGCSIDAEHDGHVGAQPDAVRGAVGLEPLLGVDLVGAEHGPDLVVEDLRRRARAGSPGPASLQPAQVVDQGLAEAARPLGHLEGGEAVDVDAVRRRADGPDHLEVVVAVEARVDAALEADLGGPGLLGLDAPGR